IPHGGTVRGWCRSAPDPVLGMSADVRWRVSISGGAPRNGRPVKRHGGSVRYVEARKRTARRDRNQPIAGLCRELAQALAFGTEDERGSTCKGFLFEPRIAGAF